MSFYHKKQLSDVALYGDNSVESGGSLDIESGATLEIAGTAITATAAELNLNDNAVQAMTADGAITITNGYVTLDKAGVLAATLADPNAVTDNGKRLTIVALSAQAHTVTSASGFGNGGAGENVATFSGVIGDCISLIALRGYWYVVGAHQVTIA